MPPWQIAVFEGHGRVFDTVLEGAVELGRQNNPGEKPFAQQRDESKDRWRIVIARGDESLVSRKHVLAEPLLEGGLRVTNLSAKLPVLVQHGPEVTPGCSVEIALPVILMLGGKTVHIEEVVEDEAPLQALAEATMAPAVDGASVDSRFASAGFAEAGTEAENLIRMMRITMDVLHSAANSLDFFSRAARAVVELVRLDWGRVMLLEKGTWKVQSAHRRIFGNVEPERTPSRQVLNRMTEQKRTFWQEPTVGKAEGSLVGVHAVVAAPILNRHGEVIGALYGDRGGQGGFPQPLTKLDAMLLELLASGVAAGLARVEMEQAAVRARVQFEQFFTPELSRELEANPDLLQGRDREVSVLFCDIRRFSRISGQLGPTKGIAWINSILGALSECVLDHGGVLVDYIGDELMAMWGAPKDQPDHAHRACRAALAMLEGLPKFQEQWLSVLKEPMGLGIGINSGMARVGNVGSDHKFKYGPHGPTVNVASRVQGATKYLKSLLLITEATQQALGGEFSTRRLCQVHLVNIEQPVTLYELVESPSSGWAELKQAYEAALEQFERRQFLQAAHLLGQMLPAHPGDGPSLILMSRAVNCLAEEATSFDPVWQLPGK